MSQGIICSKKRSQFFFPKACEFAYFICNKSKHWNGCCMLPVLSTLLLKGNLMLTNHFLVFTLKYLCYSILSLSRFDPNTNRASWNWAGRFIWKPQCLMHDTLSHTSYRDSWLRTPNWGGIRMLESVCQPKLLLICVYIFWSYDH